MIRVKCRWTGTPRQAGFALVLALGVLVLVTMSAGLMERVNQQSLAASTMSLAKVQAEWACQGAAVRAAANPPTDLSYYPYYGTNVEITNLDPPVSVMKELLETGSIQGPVTLRMFCAQVAGPAGDGTAEATWYYLVQVDEPPQIRLAWSGALREQPYE